MAEQPPDASEAFGKLIRWVTAWSEDPPPDREAVCKAAFVEREWMVEEIKRLRKINDLHTTYLAGIDIKHYDRFKALMVEMKIDLPDD